ncbi:MAG: helix-hairpin-helix domain-containing protein [Finegoldia sp.]|nr:helix-hairpin-helix domain-containing protein [Finegoldia sp.]
MRENINKEHIIIAILIVLLAIIGFRQSDQGVSLNSGLVSPDKVETESAQDKQVEDQVYMCHIDGEVKNPGVYSFTEGDRLKDVIEKAGGLTDKADMESVNLSAKVKDEMKIHILSKEEALKNEANLNQVTTTSDTQAGEKVNINTADIDKLKSLPGIGDSKAKKIIDFRENNQFKSIEDIKNVDGIGEKTFENLKDYISIN